MDIFNGYDAILEINNNFKHGFIDHAKPNDAFSIEGSGTQYPS